jgi:hypothetical protein
MAKASPMIISMERNCGRMFSKDFRAFLSASFVFFLSLMKESTSPVIAKAYSI